MTERVAWVSYEVVPMNGIGIAFEVQRVPVTIPTVFPQPQAGNHAARSAVPVPLFEAYRAIRIVGGVPVAFVADV